MLIDDIKQFQNNRYPLLFIDKIIEVCPGESVKALKCYSYNEWFFPAHFEDEPNVPGFVLVESMVQTFIMTFLTFPEHKGKKTSFINITNVKFFKQVIPGDVLILEAVLDSFKRGIAKGRVVSKRDNEVVCKGEFTVALPTDILRI